MTWIVLNDARDTFAVNTYTTSYLRSIGTTQTVKKYDHITSGQVEALDLLKDASLQLPG
jgi:hypothetical protein